MGLVKKEPSLASLLPTAPSTNQRRTSFGLSRKQFKTRRVTLMLRTRNSLKNLLRALIIIKVIEIKH